MPKRAAQLWQCDGKLVLMQLLGQLPGTAPTARRVLMSLKKSKSFSSLFSELLACVMPQSMKSYTVPKLASPEVQLGHVVE